MVPVPYSLVTRFHDKFFVRNQNGHWDKDCLREFAEMLEEGEKSRRALEATIYSVVETDREPNRFLVNLASFTLHNLMGNKIGKCVACV
jgi:hypothetical protein